MTFVEFVRDLPPQMGPEQVRASLVLLVHGGPFHPAWFVRRPFHLARCAGTLPARLALGSSSTAFCFCLQAAGQYRRYLADWLGAPWRASFLNAASASPCLSLQAAAEYRRYLADWWGDAIKAEFEERKHEAG